MFSAAKIRPIIDMAKFLTLVNVCTQKSTEIPKAYPKTRLIVVIYYVKENCV